MEKVYAQVDIGGLSTSLTRFKDFGSFVTVIVFNATVIAGIICLLILVVGGFRFIMAAGSGDTKQMESGKKAISAAVAGIVIIFTSVWIVQIVQSITGMNITNQP